MKENPLKQRRYPRIPSSYRLLVQKIDENKIPKFSTARVIGLGGCMFTTDHSLGDGATLLLTILVEHNVVEVKARVVYELAKGEHEFEVGVEFLEVAPMDKAILETLFPAPSEEGGS